jgi:hypothetical protein
MNIHTLSQLKHLTTYLKVLSLTALAATATAAPVIESVSLELANSADTLEIIGTGFSGAPTVVLFDNFENGELGQYVQPSDAIIGSWKEIPDTSPKPNYTQESTDNIGFLARDLRNSGGGQRPLLQFIFDQSYQTAFISYSVKVPEGSYFSGAATDKTFPDSSSWKFIWLMSNEGLRSADGLFDLAIPTHGGRGTFLIGGNDGNISYLWNASNWWSWHDFNNMSFHISLSESAPVEWSFAVINPKRLYQVSGNTSPDKFSGTDYQFNRLDIPRWWGNGDTANFQAIYDNVYVAVGINSRSRIVVTDDESFEASSKSVTLPPASWTENKITMDASLIPGWGRVYIHIFDSEGNRTQLGEALCPSCPMPITPNVD